MKNNPIDKAIKYCEKEAERMFEKGGVLHNWDNGQAAGIKYCALPRIKQIRRELIKKIQAEIESTNLSTCGSYGARYIDGLTFALNLIKAGKK